LNPQEIAERQFHYFPRSLTLPFPAPNSIAHWAFICDGTAFLFVHGFNGHATRTWDLFPGYLISNPVISNDTTNLKRADAIFYGYDSLTKQVWTNADRLYDLLRLMGTNPSDMVVNPTLSEESHRPPAFSYNRIILVSHSLGAVLCRKALLKAYRKKDLWLNKIALIQFAPADMGAHLPILLKEVMFPLLPTSILYGYVKLYAQVIFDVSVGSEPLKRLREDTLECLRNDPAAPLKARCVVHASDERVVVQDEFIPDEEMIRIDGKGHSEVCKPTKDYMKPLEILIEHS